MGLQLIASGWLITYVAAHSSSFRTNVSAARFARVVRSCRGLTLPLVRGVCACAGVRPSVSCHVPSQEAGDELAVLGCKHHGHMDTMLQWLETKGSCPICRSQDLRLDTVRTELKLHLLTPAPAPAPAPVE